MKLYFSYAAIGFIASNVIFVGLFLAQLGVPTESSRWIHECATHKTKIAKRKHGNKLVIVSGSNGLFGVRSADIEKKIGIPSVNYSIHAGLGRYIFDQAKGVLAPGDIALLPLEYSYYYNTRSFHEKEVDYISARDPEHFLGLGILGKIRFISSVSFKRIRDGFRFPREKTSGYDSKTLNGHGDETYNQSTELTVKKIGSLRPTPKDQCVINNNAVKAIDEFIDWARSHGVTLIATYPSFLFFQEYEEPSYREFFLNIEAYWKKNAVLTIGDPYMFMYPDHLMYDTLYHPNHDGTTIRTNKIISLLERLIEDGKLPIHPSEKSK